MHAQFEMQKQSPVGWATAGTASSVYGVVSSPGKWRLTSAYFCPDVTAAADGSHYASLAIKNGSTTIGTALTSASVAFTAGTAREFTLSGGTSLEFTEGDEIVFDKAVTGNGVAITGSFHCTFEKVQADSLYT